MIPIDLIIEILSRLPAKSVTRFRCVSKLWDSIILRPHFTESFLTSSWSRPKLLFSCQKNGELFFFSSPQSQNLDVNSSVVRADRLTRFRFDGSCRIGSSVSGLVCVTQLQIVKGRMESVPVICNPSMVKSLLLPKVKTTRVGVNCFFGYDPIEKQFKVLSMTSYYGKRGISKDHQVLMLGTHKHSWRMIECYIPHDPEYDGICIDGGLYYHATFLGPPTVYVIVCFDLRSEKFMFINKPQEIEHPWCYSTLVNYKGKLGALMSDGLYTVTRGRKCFELWVLEDAKKHEWSKHIFVLPSWWKNVAGATTLFFVGMTSTNEIVLSPHYLLDPCYVFYYNTEMKTIRRVEIQGMDAFKNCRVYISLNHVDNLKL